MKIAVAAAASLSLLLSFGPARAATRAFAETYETRTGGEGDAQVETWIDNQTDSGSFTIWRFWWGGTASLTDAWEVSAYVLASQQRDGLAALAVGQESSGLQLEKLELMTRYRLIGDGLTGFSAMLQLEVGIPFEPTGQDQINYADLNHATDVTLRAIAAYDAPHFVAAANVSATTQAILAKDASGYTITAYAKYAAGIAYAPLQPGLRGPPLTIGIEAFGDMTFSRVGVWSIWWPGDFPFAVGPALSFARGRFWATASYGYAPGGAFAGAFPNVTYSGSEGVGRLIVAFEF